MSPGTDNSWKNLKKKSRDTVPLSNAKRNFLLCTGLLCRGGEHEYRLTKYLLSNYEEVSNIFTAFQFVIFQALPEKKFLCTEMQIAEVYCTLAIWRNNSWKRKHLSSSINRCTIFRLYDTEKWYYLEKSFHQHSMQLIILERKSN
jgi:hypothetical protein